MLQKVLAISKASPILSAREFLLVLRSGNFIQQQTQLRLLLYVLVLF